MSLSIDGWPSSGWSNAPRYELAVGRDELPDLVHKALIGLKGIRIIDVDRDGGTLPLGSYGFGGGSAIHLRFESISDSSTRVLARVTGFGLGGRFGGGRNRDTERLISELRRLIAAQKEQSGQE